VTPAPDSQSPPSPSFDPGSFRDRTARVFYLDGAVCRGLNADAWDEWQHVSSSSFFQRAMGQGSVVKTETADDAMLASASLSGEWTGVLRHQRLPFVSYPYEWSFGMLKDAALLQLELMAAALEEGFLLKDATPYNVQWEGSRPVFIDVTSFVRWRPGEPWAGYRQFCQQFLYPLFLQAYKGVPFQPWLRGRLDGIEAAECRRLMSLRDLLRPGVLTHVVAHSGLQHRYAAVTPKVKQELRQAGFHKSIITATIGRLRKLVRRLEWSPPASTWSDYATCNSYDDESSRAKEAFIQRIASSRERGLVWDLGCNTGTFSKLVARHAAHVVAIDSDHASIEALYSELKAAGNRNILPLVGDVADLSPALGWRGVERRAFTDRGRPDLVLCLALVHHLAITSNIPLADVVGWLSESGAELVVEFPMPDDPMVQRLLHSRDQAYDDYSLVSFESALATHFDVRERLLLPSRQRSLYWAVPKAASVS